MKVVDGKGFSWIEGGSFHVAEDSRSKKGHNSRLGCHELYGKLSDESVDVWELRASSAVNSNVGMFAGGEASSRG